MNDSEILDGVGFIHTWIKLEDPSSGLEYFSFSNSTTSSLAGLDAEGHMTDDLMENRVPTSQIIIEVTDKQYSDIIKNALAFENGKHNYDIFPDNEGDFNCTTAAGYVLSQSGIHYLDGLQNPYAVSNRIDNTDRLPNSNIMDPSKTPKSDPIFSLETALDIKDEIDNIKNYGSDKIIELAGQLSSYIPTLKPELDKINDNKNSAIDYFNALLNAADELEKNGAGTLLAKLGRDIYDYIKRKKYNLQNALEETNKFVHDNPHLTPDMLPFAAAGFFLGKLFGPSLSDAERTTSPIILDLDGDGVETISLSDGVYFDHDNNSFAEKTGWVGKDDGLLVLDINHDGNIDSGSELFGNNTYLKDGTLAKNGYLALQELDDDHNGKIDSADAIWQQLNIWQDKNSNGKVDTGELLSLRELKVDSISTSYTTSSAVDKNGNSHSQNGHFMFTEGSTGESSDVWFEMDRGNTHYIPEADLSSEVLAMPYIRGFGNIVDLHVAIAKNTELKALVDSFISSPTSSNINTLVDEIIYSWSGINHVENGSRGIYVDAKKLAVLEMASGENYLNKTNNTVNPLSQAGAVLTDEYQKFHQYILAQLLYQTIYKEEFSLITPTIKNDLSGFSLNFNTFNSFLESIKKSDPLYFISLTSTASSLLTYMPQFYEEIDLLSSYSQFYILSDSTDGRLAGHTYSADTYLFAAGHGQDTIVETATKEEQADTLRFAGANAASARFSKEGNDLIVQAYGAEDAVTLIGYFSYTSNRFLHFAFDDKTLGTADLEAMLMVVNGTEGNDSLNGWYAGDMLTGGEGNDNLYGNAGHDILDGGAGNDRLNGGAYESDTYLFAAGHGQDTISETADKEEQADTLRFAGARAAEARFSKQGNDLIIQAYGDDDTVTIPDYFNYASHRFLRFAFEDKTLSIADLEAMLMVVNGTAGNDSLNGWYTADILTGGAGNDTLYGNAGNDILDGGAGNDFLNGGTNESDTYLFAAGHGKDSVIDSATKNEQADTLRFAGARVAEARFSKQGSNLIIQAYGDDDAVTLPDYFNYASHRLLRFAFEDKTLGVADLEAKLMVVNGTAGNDYLNGWYAADILTGGAGNDTLNGNAGSDILDGGAGNDTLNGGTNESDTYLFAAGHGKDSVIDSATKDEQADTLRFAGARAAEARFSKQGSNLIIQAYGDDDAVTLPDYFNYASHRLLRFAFEDKTLGVADLETMLMVVNGTEGNDSLNGWYTADILTGGAGRDTLYGNAGSDILDGGTGNDTLNGGSGSDTYLFAKGHGQDVVYDSLSTAGESDTLLFTDAQTHDLWFSKTNKNLLICEIGSADSVTLENWFNGANYQNKKIMLDDGQYLESTQVQLLVEAMAVFSAGQDVSAMQPEQMKENMHLINSSDYWSHV
ncbi:calcium-binding protein [Rahnella sp. AA]|uniref:calcium-binding protein n=1 Tax=Rahnella sp. AA TaxID=2057180 RepID=UPI0018E37A27|nr:calcium-binding protein [Rahnella sp. AA]